MYTIQSTVSFEAAHRLYNVNTYSTECRDNVHGHSYKVGVVVSRDTLNDAGMVIDFKQFKKILKDKIESRYDHSCIIRAVDPLAESIVTNCKKVFVVDKNPTAEWMAQQFYDVISAELASLDDKLRLVSVSVQETENNIACYFGGDI